LVTEPKKKERLILLDGHSLVYRAFFALPSLTDRDGRMVNAAYGFTMMLNKIIADEKPTHVIAAFDKGLPAARVDYVFATADLGDRAAGSAVVGSRNRPDPDAGVASDHFPLIADFQL